jgi:hypothetical protein
MNTVSWTNGAVDGLRGVEEGGSRGGGRGRGREEIIKMLRRER